MQTQSPALVIAAHGSRSASWVDAVNDLVHDVEGSPGVREVFSSVTAGFLEESQPTLADAVTMSLEVGCPEVIVVPLFLSAARHQSEDVPAVLGLPVPAHIRRRVEAEGMRTLAPGLPIRLVQLGDVAEIIHKNVVRRLSLEVSDPSREAVVLVAYGSAIFHDEWEALMHDVRLRLLRDGYAGVSHAYCGHVSQLSPEPTYRAILHASQQAGVKRVHVLPVLLAVSELQSGPIASAFQSAFPKLAKEHVQLRYTGDAILPDGDLAARVAFVALAAVGVVAPMWRPLSGGRIGRNGGSA